MCKKIIWQLLTYAISLALALLIVNTLCYSIYWHPEKYFAPNLSTEAIHQPNKPIVEGLEGYTVLHTDSFGYINEKDLDMNKPCILCMGSSDTLSKNVDFDEQYCQVLEDKLTEDGKSFDVYNAGFEAHGLDLITKHFRTAMQQFSTARIIVLEIAWLPSEEKLRAATKSLENAGAESDYVPFNMDKYNKSVGKLKTAINTVSSYPYPRLVYSQVLRIGKNTQAVPFVQFLFNKKGDTDDEAPINYESFEETLAKNLSALKNAAGGRTVILLHNPYMRLNPDGSMTTTANAKRFKMIENACRKSGVYYADTKENVIEMYNRDNYVFRGFQNTSMCNGHINKYGHAAIAKTLYEVIKDNGLK